ncbi:hypothetical protein E2C01_018954 [Portunus trituberculatus]|uniref:Uncharacterized protein n=1 Tax=Portunus trituberculatus TaxID=210409 RepID=A0A5B7DW13_PORTR|nr:hypothetical protein [Portunus trituberculatus]
MQVPHFTSTWAKSASANCLLMFHARLPPTRLVPSSSLPARLPRRVVSPPLPAIHHHHHHHHHTPRIVQTIYRVLSESLCIPAFLTASLSALRPSLCLPACVPSIAVPSFLSRYPIANELCGKSMRVPACVPPETQEGCMYSVVVEVFMCRRVRPGMKYTRLLRGVHHLHRGNAQPPSPPSLVTHLTL